MYVIVEMIFYILDTFILYVGRMVKNSNCLNVNVNRQRWTKSREGLTTCGSHSPREQITKTKLYWLYPFQEEYTKNGLIWITSLH